MNAFTWGWNGICNNLLITIFCVNGKLKDWHVTELYIVNTQGFILNILNLIGAVMAAAGSRVSGGKRARNAGVRGTSLHTHALK